MTAGNNSGINHTKTVGALTVAQRDALLRMMNNTRDIPARTQPNHSQSAVPHYFKNVSGETVPAFVSLVAKAFVRYSGDLAHRSLFPEW